MLERGSLGLTGRKGAWAAALAFFLMAAGPAVAAKLGDPAPPLSIAEWVKGGPVDLAAGKGKNITVVEFWATWCPPCRTSIPHLTELQKKFKDKGVVFVGISNEELGTVASFVKEQGGQMDYVVAIDRGRATSDGYMKAFEQNGIPHAFIVDKDGKFAWHGHPMAGLDEALEKLTAHGAPETPAKAASASQAQKGAKLFSVYMRLVEELKEDELAEPIGRAIVRCASDDPALMKRLARAIVTNAAIEEPDIALAKMAAKAARLVSEEKDASVLEVSALVHSKAGEIKEAVDFQKKAIAASQDESERKRLEEQLKRYEEEARKTEQE
jgi:thiol-disulfide isomerase/thioredoxin